MAIQDHAVIEDDELGDDMDSDDLGNFAYGINADHHVRFERRGPELLVAFDVAEPDAKISRVMPHLGELAAEMDWSVLSLVSRGHTWFRDPEVITFFDALVDGTLMDQFDEVLFYGVSSGGHAALSYALTAPFSRVLALAPQARMDAETARWDTRFGGPRDVDFTSRFAPDAANLETAETAWIAHDPLQPEDARHAAMLEGAATVLPLACRHMGSGLERALGDLGVLDDLVCEAMAGTLDARVFYSTLRARRDDTTYLRRLVARLIAADRPYLEALVVRNIAQRMKRNRYARRYEKLAADLAAQGIRLPESRYSATG